ncbi:MAG: ThuA domain-containing protein [Chloroflexi bacterium]|nr:ThuA domain-containing protein [Chloroflexota bacterium]
MKLNTTKLGAALILALAFNLSYRTPAEDWVVYEGKEGAGKGKHIVFVTGDEEYRSEEGLPMLARILAERHGFKCTVLFSLNPEDGTIDPNNQTNIVGLEKLATADMMVLFTRFREWPDDKMKYFVDFVNSGKPMLGIRTATHAFAYSGNKNSPYAKYSFQSREWPGGFGQQVLGDTWISHHGNHGKESTRGIINEAFKNHPILKGVTDIWGPTDVYGIIHLPADAQVLVFGQVLEGMNLADKPVSGKKNDPMMPLIWIRNYTGESSKSARVLCTTIGASVDLESEGLRRVLVNACYWGLGLEDRIAQRSNVDYVGEFKPTYFGGGKFKKGVKPADLQH